MSWERFLTVSGIIFILIGISLIFISIIVKLIPTPDLEKIPWFLLYVYRKNGFFFATSPVLIIFGIVYLLWKYLHN